MPSDDIHTALAPGPLLRWQTSQIHFSSTRATGRRSEDAEEAGGGGWGRVFCCLVFIYLFIFGGAPWCFFPSLSPAVGPWRNSFPRLRRKLHKWQSEAAVTNLSSLSASGTFIHGGCIQSELERNLGCKFRMFSSIRMHLECSGNFNRQWKGFREVVAVVRVLLCYCFYFLQKKYKP